MMGVRFWVKSYDVYNRLECNGCEDRDSAFSQFQSKMQSGGFYFVQMDVSGDDGAIVLNEWRKPMEPSGFLA
jgi:hypothetical protein